MDQSQKTKREIVEIGKRLYQKGFVVANEGNVSAKLNQRVIVTPTMKCKGFLTAKDLVTVDFMGRKTGGQLEPTSELLVHLLVYKKRPDVAAVIHAHPPYSTALAVAGLELPENVLPEVFLSLGKIPLAAYGTPSTQELPDSIEDLIMRHDAILLKNHGVLTVGRELEETYFKLERVEHFARIFSIADSLGRVEKIPEKQMDKLQSIKSGPENKFG
jgi:L-fuculose-phosphate aldolase